MYINEKILMELLWEKAPDLEFSQIEDRVKEFRGRLRIVDGLMMNWEEWKMKSLLAALYNFSKDFKSVESEVEKHKLTGFGGLAGALVGLLGIANPVGRLLLLGGGLLMLSKFGDVENTRKCELARILKVIDDDGTDFEEMGKAIHRLDYVCKQYLNCSLQSKEGKQILEESVLKSSVTENLNEYEELEKMDLLFKKIAAAQAINKDRISLKAQFDK